MLATVPTLYHPARERFRDSLDLRDPLGKKVRWNFECDPRVPDEVRDLFMCLVDQDLDENDPLQWLGKIKEPAWFLKGPEPASPPPERLALMVNADHFIGFLSSADEGNKNESEVSHHGRLPRSGTDIVEIRWTVERLIELIRARKILENLPEKPRFGVDTGFLWVTDADRLLEVCRAHGLDEARDRLGLDFSHYHAGQKALVITIATDSIRRSNLKEPGPCLTIPTVMEGRDYAPFTPAAPDQQNSGFTIDLRTGEDGLPEWVAKPVRLDLGLEFFMDPLQNRGVEGIILERDPSREYLNSFHPGCRRGRTP